MSATLSLAVHDITCPPYRHTTFGEERSPPREGVIANGPSGPLRFEGNVIEWHALAAGRRLGRGSDHRSDGLLKIDGEPEVLAVAGGPAADAGAGAGAVVGEEETSCGGAGRGTLGASGGV